MDVLNALSATRCQPITCVDMHTCGEPTRIVIKGYPELQGTLLEQRAQAKAEHDHIRRRLMLEPRGHFDMYGAILRHATELTGSGDADIGVLFTTNDGYSTMCGHATIALGRFLVDTQDLSVFPNRQRIRFDAGARSALLRLHAPCGLVMVQVPTTSDGRKSDPSRPVSFTSVDCFATGLNIQLSLPEHPLWPKGLSVNADFAYGGAFYCLVSVDQLPFLKSGLRNFDMDAANQFTRLLKQKVNDNPDLSFLFRHPYEDDLSFLYSVILVDKDLGEPLSGSLGAETGLCFFSNQQIDRSPTGSGVSARLAAAYAHGKLQQGDSQTYHSLVSLHKNRKAAFQGTILSINDDKMTKYHCVRTKIEGFASYTGYHTFVAEDGGMLTDGFTMNALALLG